MTIQGVLVEYENPTDKEIYTNSGLLFSNKYVIITGNVLTPYLKQFDLKQLISTLEPGVLNFDFFSKNKPQLRVVIKQNTTLQSELKLKKAQALAVFVCKNIFGSSRKYLSDWAIDFENKKHQVIEVLALFFVFKIGDGIDVNESKSLNGALCELLENARKFELGIGHEVFIEGTPFGNRAFVNSYSQGVISNVAGEKLCFLLTDCPSAPGSEGCPLFIKTKFKERCAIGIVISCLNWWKGEWVGLTLAASLVPLLSQIVFPKTESLSFIKNPRDDVICVNRKLLFATTNSLVQIVCGSSWGTGILLNKEKGIFLTNSHVIESDYDVNLHWKNEHIKATVLYKTPNSDVYDLAVLQCDSSLIRRLDIAQVEISLKQPEIGEEVFATGYPLFSRDLKPKPSLSKGHISQVDQSMIKTTCCVLPGASGGAIFRPEGQLVAVIASNTKMEDLGAVFPRVNMAIPILAVYSVIEKFLQTGDLSQLKKLQSTDALICRPWNYFLGKL